MRDLYEILGVSPSASSDEIRLAYRSKVKEVHPDTGGSSEAFGEVVVAYETLIDPDRRQTYDETGSIDSDNEIHQGAKLLVERLLNELIHRDDIKYFDAIALMDAHVTHAINDKRSVIQILEARQRSLNDLKNRFKPKLDCETHFHDFFESKILEISQSIASERLIIAQLHAASVLISRYNFVKEMRSGKNSSDIDASAFGRTFDPLLDTSKLFGDKR